MKKGNENNCFSDKQAVDIIYGFHFHGLRVHEKGDSSHLLRILQNFRE
jgi:hypothetical protein